MDSPESQETESPNLRPEHNDESMSLIVEEIDQSDSFSPERAKSIGLMYTLYSQGQVEDVFREHPNAVVMGKFADHLGMAVEMARGGDYGEVARFLRSEAIKIRDGVVYPKDSPETERWKKIMEIADILDKSAA